MHGIHVRSKLTQPQTANISQNTITRVFQGNNGLQHYLKARRRFVLSVPLMNRQELIVIVHIATKIKDHQG